jgi:hypothetical protein
MMWSVQPEMYDADYMDTGGGEDPADPANPAAEQRLSQDEQIKAHEAELANEARRVAELEQYQQHQRKLEEAYRIQQQEAEWQQLLLLQQRQQLQFDQQQYSRRKEVTFADSALLYSNDRTREEIDSMWYSKDELEKFKSERKSVVKALKKTHFDVAAVERKGYCLRGYEAYFSLDINKAMKDSRALAISLVLTEQDRQRAVGMKDPEALRFAGAAVSQWAGDNALKLGESDEVEVYGIYNAAFGGASDGYYAPAMDTYYPLHPSHNYDQDMMMEPIGEIEEDNLADRLESALRLVRALRSGTQTSIGS